MNDFYRSANMVTYPVSDTKRYTAIQMTGKDGKTYYWDGGSVNSLWFVLKIVSIFLVRNELSDILFIFASYQQLRWLFNKTSIVLTKPISVSFLMFSFALNK